MIRVLIACAIVLALGACDRQRRVVVKPVPVEVVRYVRASIDPVLTAPIVVRAPEGLCWRDTQRVLCNGQLADLALEYRAALEQCNVDRQAIATDGERP